MFKFLLSLVLLLPTLVSASDLSQSQIDLITDKLFAADPNLPISEFSKSPVEGFVEVTLAGGETLAVSGDGEYLFAGKLFQITDTGFKDIADERAAVQRGEYFSKNDPDKLGGIVFPANGEVKKKMFVFTDISCGFCRKLHKETVPDLQKAGIEVVYLGFPREGLDGNAKKDLDTAFCSDDQQTTLTALKNRESVPAKTCDSPVAEHYALAKQFGINSTPSTVLSDGTLIRGYMLAPAMLKALGVE